MSIAQTCGNIPTAEAEERFYAMLGEQKQAAWLIRSSLRHTRGDSLVWRDICRATDERTVIASFIPMAGADFTLRVNIGQCDTAHFVPGLVANLNAIPLDYVSWQQSGGTHLADFVSKQLPVSPPAFYTRSRLASVVPRVLELTYTSHALAPCARDLGHQGPPFRWDEDRRAYLRADLDAFYARAYDLSRDELRFILDPADVRGPDHPSKTFHVLKEKEIRQYGEYRTARLVLAAWDCMDADGSFRSLGL